MPHHKLFTIVKFSRFDATKTIFHHRIPHEKEYFTLDLSSPKATPFRITIVESIRDSEGSDGVEMHCSPVGSLKLEKDEVLQEIRADLVAHGWEIHTQ